MIEVGVFDHLDRGTIPLSDFYEQRLAIVEAYDRAGFFCYHLAEHHATPIGTAPSPSLFLSAVAQRTKRLRFGPLVYLLPFYHPLRLIEEICMLDQMSGGRLEIGTGRGISPVEARLYGIDPNESQARYVEALEVIRRGLTTDVLSFAGTYYRFDSVPMELTPVQRPMPPLWLGVHSPESAERAARAGAGAVTNEGTSRARAVAERYRAAWTRTGAPEPMPKIGIVRFLVVADSDDRALDVGRRAYRKWHESFYFLHRMYGMRATHEKSPSFDDALEEGTAFAGTPETVTAALRAHLEETRANYLVGQFAFGDLTLDETLGTIALFRDRVLPALQPVSR